jgi:anti-sigma factor RsiW
MELPSTETGEAASDLLVQAYLDGELDVANSISVERMIEADPALASRVTDIHALQNALREKFPREPVPPYLKSRIDSALGRNAIRHRPTWTLMAASMVTAIALSSSAMWFALQNPASGVLAGELVDSHMRSLIAPQPIDVASSDRHTVKPWFNEKITKSPRVLDLSGQGFPLVGGRIDVVGKAPVPTLVYNRRRHVISVTALSSSSGRKDLMALPPINGFNMTNWDDGDTSYWAISDLNVAELTTFAKLFQQAE